jgi:hypothetical protein
MRPRGHFIARNSFEVNAGEVSGATDRLRGSAIPDCKMGSAAGAQIVFHRYLHQEAIGPGSSELQTGAGPTRRIYYEGMMCRGLENTIYFASVNYAFRYQESATSLDRSFGRVHGISPTARKSVLSADRCERRSGVSIRPSGAFEMSLELRPAPRRSSDDAVAADSA